MKKKSSFIKKYNYLIAQRDILKIVKSSLSIKTMKKQFAKQMISRWVYHEMSVEKIMTGIKIG